MVVLEIAGGVILAVIVLSAWRHILGFTLAYIGAVTAVVFALFALDEILGASGLRFLARLVLDLGYGVLVLGAAGYVYSRFKGEVPERDAQEWAEKSTYDRWVHRIAYGTGFFIFAGGGLCSLLSGLGVLK
jgi:hypothetical protein